MARGNIFTCDQAKAQIVAPFPEINFFDRQSISLSKEIQPLEAWRKITSKPPVILKLAFYLRDRISGWFGVRHIKGFSGTWPEKVVVNDQLDFFLVEALSDQILILTVRDKHLDVMTCISTDHKRLTITSSVKTHNAFGRAYMILVGPVHRLIVRGDLKRFKETH